MQVSSCFLVAQVLPLATSVLLPPPVGSQSPKRPDNPHRLDLIKGLLVVEVQLIDVPGSSAATLTGGICVDVYVICLNLEALLSPHVFVKRPLDLSFLSLGPSLVHFSELLLLSFALVFSLFDLVDFHLDIRLHDVND